MIMENGKSARDKSVNNSVKFYSSAAETKKAAVVEKSRVTNTGMFDVL